MANELYTLLGIEPEATDKEVRKAYFLTLKQFPVDKFPQKHQDIREAYDTLKDQNKRSEYDAKQEAGTDTEPIIVEAKELMEAENYEGAIVLLKKAVVLVPTEESQLLLARAYFHNKEPELGLKISQRLSKKYNENIILHNKLGWLLLGFVIVETENKPDNQWDIHKKLLKHSKNYFQTSLNLNDTLPEPYDGLGQIEYYLERYDRCQRWHKKRLSCYSSTDVEGIDAILRLMETDAALDKSLRESRIPEIRQRIPAGQDGIDLVQSIVGARAFQAFQGEDYNFGKILANFLCDINPCEENSELARVCRVSESVIAEFNAVLDDEDMYTEFKQLCAWAFNMWLDLNEDSRSDQFTNALDSLDSAGNYSGVKSELLKMKHKYPTIWESQEEVFEDLLSRVNDAIQTPQTYSSSPAHIDDGCGCMIFLFFIPFIPSFYSFMTSFA